MTNLIPFTPFNNGIIIESPKIEDEKVLSSGIALPDGMKASDFEQKEFKGYKVLAVGPNCTQVKVGDVVMFNSNAIPDGFMYNKVLYAVFREHHVVVINNSVEVKV
jgi:co-chaperonin GroES (HSP10)